MNTFLFTLLSLATSLVAALGVSETFQLVPGGKAFDRFITIWLENQDYAKVVVNSHFANLKRQGILLTKYYAHTHPSQPNYVAAVGGDYFGLNHDSPVHIPDNVSTVVDLFDTKGISWGGYFEDQPGPGYQGEASTGASPGGLWDYVRKHNPFVSYDSIAHNGSRMWCLGSFKDLITDMAARQVPQFVFMTPNMLNDGHNTTLDYATKWSASFLPKLLTADAFPANERTLILLTYDESEDYSQPNKIASLLLGSAVPQSLHGTEDDTFYTHYSILSSVQHNWALPNLGRYDVGANVWKMQADASGFVNKGDPDTLAGINSSMSYPGFLNSDPAKYMPVPPPNLRLVGAGGQGVLGSITGKWQTKAGDLSPYDGVGEPFDGGQWLPEYVPQESNIR